MCYASMLVLPNISGYLWTTKEVLAGSACGSGRPISCTEIQASHHCSRYNLWGCPFPEFRRIPSASVSSQPHSPLSAPPGTPSTCQVCPEDSWQQMYPLEPTGVHPSRLQSLQPPGAPSVITPYSSVPQGLECAERRPL